jgi:hypothetical protein
LPGFDNRLADPIEHPTAAANALRVNPSSATDQSRIAPALDDGRGWPI